MNTAAPVCECGEESTWIDNGPRLQYFYCRPCKAEVELQEPPHSIPMSLEEATQHILGVSTWWRSSYQGNPFQGNGAVQGNQAASHPSQVQGNQGQSSGHIGAGSAGIVNGTGGHVFGSTQLGIWNCVHCGIIRNTLGSMVPCSGAIPGKPAPRTDATASYQVVMVDYSRAVCRLEDQTGTSNVREVPLHDVIALVNMLGGSTQVNPGDMIHGYEFTAYPKIMPTPGPIRVTGSTSPLQVSTLVQQRRFRNPFLQIIADLELAQVVKEKEWD